MRPVYVAADSVEDFVGRLEHWTVLQTYVNLRDAMKRVYMRLQGESYEAINNGDKLVEFRKWDSKRQTITPGDEIVFTNGDQSCRRTVESLLVSRSFADLVPNIRPITDSGVRTRQQLLRSLEKTYPGNTGDGPVVAIFLKPERSASSSQSAIE